MAGGPYNIPRNTKGEGRFFYIFSTKALIVTAVLGGMAFFVFRLIGSLIGFTALGVIGALIIGVSAFIVNVSPDITHSICIAIVAGMVGCFADSLLGATLERNGLFNNEHVNLTATIIGALVGIIIITIGA